MTDFAPGRLVQRALMLAVRGYRLLLKPWIGNACRFEPTCSAYALQALERHGAARGSALAAARILRCHPWCDGGLDPVPEALGQGLFTALLQRGGRGPSQLPAPSDPISPTRNLP